MKKWLIVVLCVALFLVSAICGFIVNSFINFSENKEEREAVLAETNGTNNETVDTNASNITVSPNAEVVLSQKFERCGHSSVVREIAPREIVNLSQDKVQEYYEGWNIDKFSANEIRLSRNNPGICDEHYVLRESDGFISISCKNDIGEYIFKGLTDISVQYLPEEDLNKLQNGIEVVGRDNLNKVLEDFE